MNPRRPYRPAAPRWWAWLQEDGDPLADRIAFRLFTWLFLMIFLLVCSGLGAWIVLARLTVWQGR